MSSAGGHTHLPPVIMKIAECGLVTLGVGLASRCTASLDLARARGKVECCYIYNKTKKE